MTVSLERVDSFTFTSSRRREILERIREAAAKVLLEEDPWAKYDIQSIPAERIIRYSYDPLTCEWRSNESIAKMEKEPFTHGAMRHCFRMKKMAPPPKDASNTRFHSYGWSRAPNYVAKCYTNEDGTIKTDEGAKQDVRNDIMLQYEAARWAEKFNERDPPKKINVIRAYVIEFPDRPGAPLFAVERFISGNCEDGEGFVKHNTNSGYVDTNLGRLTPQIFSAHSFYASHGSRLVADVQGVGDLFTDPQVHSNDYSFGEGDIGPRGMALFFLSFHHSKFADAMGIPVFPLSRNEMKHQMRIAGQTDDEQGEANSLGSEEEKVLDRFAKLDLNRRKRNALFLSLPGGAEKTDTDKRSNLAKSLMGETSAAVVVPVRSTPSKPKWHRSQSDADDVSLSLHLAMTDFVYDHSQFHRLPSGELDDSHHSDSPTRNSSGRRMTIMKKVLRPMMPDNETRTRLGLVHYHLACLHGAGRFPDIVPVSSDSPPAHDVYSALFHLCHASSLHNARSCLSLARVKSGLSTNVSNLLPTVVPVDFEGAKDLLYRTIDSPAGEAKTKAAAGCLLLQHLDDEGSISNMSLVSLLEETLDLMAEAEQEASRIELTSKANEGTSSGYKVGDRVDANFACEGTYYPATVTEVSDDNTCIVVQYDDDGSAENLTVENVRPLDGGEISKTATNVECFVLDSAENSDEKYLLERYQLLEMLADLRAKLGDLSTASGLYEQAAERAMECGKMQTATKLSLKAAQVQE